MTQQKNLCSRTAVIGSNVTLDKEEYAPLNRKNKGIRIGEYAIVNGNVYLGEEVKIGDGVIIKGDWNIEDGVEIDDGCMLKGDGTIQKNTKILYAAKLIGRIDAAEGVRINGSTLYQRVVVGKGTTIVESNIGTHPVGMQDIEIGENNSIAKSSLYGVLKIGNWNTINDAIVGSHPQIQGEREGERSLDSYLIIGDKNTIREASSIQGSPTKERATMIGNNCLIMAQTHIAHDCILEDHVIFTTGSQAAGHVYIERYARVSGKNGIAQFVRIGAYAMTSGDLAVRQDILPYFLGDPEKNTTFNKEGLKRAEVDEKQIEEIREAYRIIFHPDYERAESLEKLAEMSKRISKGGADPTFIDHLVRFIKESDEHPRRKLYFNKGIKESGQRSIDELVESYNIIFDPALSGDETVAKLEELASRVEKEEQPSNIRVLIPFVKNSKDNLLQRLLQGAGKKRKSFLRRLFFFIPPYR